MTKQITVHPILFGIYPVLFLFSRNVWQTKASVIWVPLAIVLFIVVLLWWCTTFIIKDSGKAALIVSVFLILFFVYSNVHDILLVQHGLLFGRHRYLLLIIGFVWSITAYWIARRLVNVTTANLFLNVFGATLILATIPNLGDWIINKKAISKDQIKAIRPGNYEQVTLNLPEDPPYIYYIILDGYMRSDLLDEVLQYDNSEFVSYLENKGFYVASTSRSNYPYTFLSIPSALNMEYINYLGDTVGSESHDVLATYPLIQANRVGQLLKSVGYRYVQISSGWSGADRSLIADDVFTWKNKGPEQAFLSLLVEMTAVYPIVQTILDDWQDERGSILFAFDEIAKAGIHESPTFVYAHIISPHPPYVFGADGEYVDEPEEGWTTESAQGAYLNQLIYTNNKVVELVDTLLAQHATPPIIIVQADHGWAWAVGWDPNPSIALDEQFDMDQVFGILNAYYLPDGKNQLYDSISPVNSFRIIFNTYFDAKLPLLQDKHYFSIYYESPYSFSDVTDSID